MPCHAASQQQIGQIGARNQQHQYRRGNQHVQTRLVAVLQLRNALASRAQLNGLLTNLLAFRGLEGIGDGRQPLPQFAGKLGLHLCRLHAGLHAANQIEPMLIVDVQRRTGLIELRLRCNGKVKIGWIVAQAVTEKSRRRNASHGEGLAIDHEGCAYH